MAAIITDTSREPAVGPGTYDQPPADVKPPPRDRLPQLSEQAEVELVGHVRNLFLRARDKKRPLLNQWNAAYKALRTRRYPEGHPSWLPRPDVPEIFPIIDALVSWVTDQEPSFDAMPVVSPLNPWYPHMSQLTEDLKVTVRSSWHVNATDAEVEKVVWDGMTYGIGWFKTVWDGSAYKGKGDAVMIRRDPYAIYPDPDATCMADLNYVIDAQTISRQQLERRFPGALARLAGQGWSDHPDSQPTALDSTGRGEMPKANPGAIAPATSPRYGLPGQDGRVGVTDDPGVTLIEAWLRTPATDDEGNTYDTWRCVCVAGNRVLMDDTAENIWSHGQHPFDRFVCTETGEFYGESLVAKLMPLQASLNRMLERVERNIDLIGNPVFMESTRAGLSRTAVTNKPGNRLTVNGDPNTQAKWLAPPPLADQIVTWLVGFYVDQMERVSGLSAVVRGATPSGRNAQGVIDSVQEAAFVRIRKTKRNLSRAIGSAGEKLASLIVEFYDAPRIVSIVGPDGQRLTTELQAQHFYLPGPDGKVPMRFQLLIDAGASQAQSRGQRVAEADALYAIGAIDEEAVLEVHDFPNRQAVVQRIREMKAAAGTMGMPPTQRAAARR